MTTDEIRNNNNMQVSAPLKFRILQFYLFGCYGQIFQGDVIMSSVTPKINFWIAWTEYRTIAQLANS